MHRNYTHERAEGYTRSALELHLHTQSIMRNCMVILGTFIILSALLRLFMTGLDQSTAWTLWLGMLGAVLLIFVLGAAQYRANTALDTRILHEIDTARTRQAHVPEASNNRHTEQD